MSRDYDRGTETSIIEATHRDAKPFNGKRTRAWVVVAIDERDALRILGKRRTKVVQRGPEAMEIARRNGVEEGGYRLLG